jgi:phage tail sheath protein FI
MPEYLAPGVYVEETSFRAKSIEGVGTSTTAFAGPTRRGPVVPAVGGAEAPAFELLTSFNDFVRIYGGLEPLEFAAAQPNYLAHAVLSFFSEGGSRLYVVRRALQRSAPSSSPYATRPANRCKSGRSAASCR